MMDESPLGGITYAQFFPSDWRSGCIMLNLEEEGLYIRCCAWMYDTGQAIPGNDATAAKLLHVQVQKYTKVMQSLIAKNKMIRSQGVIINRRVFDEIDKYRQQKAARSEAAKRREQEKASRLERELTAVILNGRDDTPPPTPPLTPLATPPPTPPRLLGGYPPTTPIGSIEGDAKKPNKINETRPEPWQSSPSPLAATGKPESRIQNPVVEREELRTINQSNDHDSAGVGADEGSLDPKAALAAQELAVLLGSQTDPDHDGAMGVVERWSKATSAQAVLDGVLDLQARKIDRTEHRMVSAHLVGQYIRQAQRNIEGKPDVSIVPVAKPPPKGIQAGEVAHGIEITDRNRIVLTGVVRAEWLEKFGGNETLLENALIAIFPKIKPNSPIPIGVQIEGGLGEICMKRVESDGRYANAVVSKAAQQSRGTTVSADGKIETSSERIARVTAEIERDKAMGVRR